MSEIAAGVLPRQSLRSAIEVGWIRSSSEIPVTNLQPASLDLSLGPVAYRLRCSFLPGLSRVRDKLPSYQMEEIDISRGAVLEQNRPYLIPLAERLELPDWLRARTNPRSSTGRLDIFTRVVVDRGQHFDEVPFGYVGEVFLEVVPRSFTVKVRPGNRLNQLRLIAGYPRLDDDELLTLHEREPLLFASSSVAPDEVAGVSDGLFLSVDLSRGARPFVGYRAKKSSALLDLDRVEQYEIDDFWERLQPERDRRLVLEPEEFYLLVSRERVRIPSRQAAEMAAYDPTSGELRTHYAGFFDPGFGEMGDGQAQGTHAVLEVRAHDVAFALEHGQRLCKLTFESMQSVPDVSYGASLGSRYQGQMLALGRQFKPDRHVRPAPSRDLQLFEDAPIKLARIRGDGDAVPLISTHAKLA